MQYAANAYAKTQTAALPPRDLEATLLLKAASRLQALLDDWEGRKQDVDSAVTYNRKLWTILASSATEETSPLPMALKQNVASLAFFVFNRSLDVMIAPAPEKISPLVNINREIAAGLRARPQAA
ncbi:flagellar biosynthesis regulatory protein FlaF [Alsobacter metallidurans]|uniref:Flagellar biosynthesis regulatory protein FlaF n=1 Tax=Alsobacter metallidurans TaxID=340221 RepID=A0A917I8L4_9HYPH|nr:flagellar biosynthesis regulator FlaF [Alsobacter metallidurans]GGH26565.1 flagellar biosynthesis regulatory protein FlaF [Alsobacter metallidurans]